MLDYQDRHSWRHRQKCPGSDRPIEERGECKCAEDPQQQQQRVGISLSHKIHDGECQNPSAHSREETTFGQTGASLVSK